MGCSYCSPLQEPIWFSYYGPVHQSGANDAINATIADHLHEIGAAPSIPMRQVVTSTLKVPVSLTTPPFSVSEGILTVNFATTCEGRITLTTQDMSETGEFNSDLKQSHSFTLNSEEHEAILKFDFDVNSGVSCRMYTLQIRSSEVTIVDDKIVNNGVISTISRIYKETSDLDDTFNDGQCLMCCSEPATVVAFPCRHCCMCKDCAQRFSTMLVHCPVCRAIVTELIDCVSPQQT